MMRFQINEQQKTILTVYAPSVVMGFGHGMAAPAIPLLAASFDVPIGIAAQVITAQIVGRILFILPSGVLVDQIGAKKSMMIGPFFLSLAAVVAALAPSFPVLLVAVFIQGAGSNLWQIAREIAVIEVVRPEQRGRAISALFGVAQIGNIVGPVVGGVVTDVWGFRALFLSYALLGVVVMVIATTLKETQQARRNRSSMFDFGRISDLDPAFRLTFLILIFGTFCMMLRLTIVSSMIPLFVGKELGFSATEVGGILGINGVVSMAMLIPAGFVSDKIGRKAAIVPAALFTSASFLVFGVSNSLLMLSVAAALQGVASGFAFGSMSTATFDIAPPGGIAKFQSLRRFSADLGALAGPPVAGAVAGLYETRGVFLFFAPLYLLSAALLTFVAKETHPRFRRVAPLIAEAGTTV
jgi:MFS family permease